VVVATAHEQLARTYLQDEEGPPPTPPPAIPEARAARRGRKVWNAARHFPRRNINCKCSVAAAVLVNRVKKLRLLGISSAAVRYIS